MFSYNKLSASFDLLFAGSALRSWIVNVQHTHDPLNGYAIAYLSSTVVFVFLALVRLGKIKGIKAPKDHEL